MNQQRLLSPADYSNGIINCMNKTYLGEQGRGSFGGEPAIAIAQDYFTLLIEGLYYNSIKEEVHTAPFASSLGHVIEKSVRAITDFSWYGSRFLYEPHNHFTKKDQDRMALNLIEKVSSCTFKHVGDTI